MPSSGNSASLDILIEDADATDAGEVVTVDADGAGDTQTATEQSATHRSHSIDCAFATFGAAGANDMTWELTDGGGTVRSISVGTAAGTDVDASVSASDQQLADDIATFINDQHGEAFVASTVNIGNGIAGAGGDPGIVANRVVATAKTPSTAIAAFAVINNTSGVGTGLTNLLDAVVSGLTGLVGGALQDDGAEMSIRLAAEDAGVDLVSGATLPSQAVDVELASQLAAVLDTAGAGAGAGFEYGASSAAVAGAGGATVTLTKDAAGTAGNAHTCGFGVGNNFSDGAANGDGTDQGGDIRNAALAAVFYQGSNAGHLRLDGELLSATPGTSTQASGAWVKSVGSDYEFRLQNVGSINGFGAVANSGDDAPGSGTVMRTTNFNFDPQSKKYIRKVLNTNPTLTNSALVEGSAAGVTSTEGFPGGNLKTYWLGETYEGHLRRTLDKNGPLTNVNGDVLSQADAATEVASDEPLSPSGRAITGALLQVACLVRLDGGQGGSVDGGNQLGSATPARSGWIFSQHLGSPEAFILDDTSGEYPDTVKLFKFHGLYSGSWDQKNLKISIENIKASGSSLNPYGSFTVSVRRSDDSDNSVKVLEKFSNCNLDPSSPNYIARKIGDVETIWSAGEQRYQEVGQYQNKSQFLRVELNPDVDAGVLDPALVPFGFFGPPQNSDVHVEMLAAPYALGRLPLNGGGDDGFNATSGDRTNAAIVQGCDVAEAMSGVLSQAALTGLVVNESGVEDQIGFDLPALSALADDGLTALPPRAILRMPTLALRQNTRQGGLSGPTKAYWGIDTSSFQSSTRPDIGYGDYLTPLAGQAEDGVDSLSVVDGVEDIHASFVFSLDDIGRENCMQDALDANGARLVGAVSGDTWADGVSQTHAEYLPENHDGFNGSADERLARCAAGARRSQCSISGTPGSDYNTTLRSGFDQFTLPLYGGSDGLDIREKEAFSNTILDAGSGNGEVGHYAYNSVKRAIDACSDPEVVECNLMAMPGITEPSLTSHLIKTCENRADALAIIDLENVTGATPGDYIPATEGVSFGAEVDRLPNVDNAVQSMEDRLLNSSYGAAYFPWVQVRDDQSNRLLWVPPSVVALGTMASSQNKSELWFAPAGFTRGGLTEGAAGLPVTNVRHKLSSKERDKLYEAAINPIASFPSEGIVIFGQKTLQMEASALDRVNVRRLLIYLKKEVSRMAATVLFDQNVQTTWSRFIGKVEPFLSGVKSRLGLTEYRVILDETTTTPDLIDRNIMYAKIMLKPARAIEFIAIDFVITNSGASFDD
jgi:hypothetical protein